MDEITVVIPAQTYDPDKYMGINGRCYLEEALDKAGHLNSRVSAFGDTTIDGTIYASKNDFGSYVIEEAFAEGKDITVTLVKVYK